VATFPPPWEARSHSTVALAVFGRGPPLISFLFFFFGPFVFCCFCLVFIVVLAPLSPGKMHARSLLLDGGETVACSRCGVVGHIGAPSRFPTFFVFCVGCWRPYQRPLPFAISLVQCDGRRLPLLAVVIFGVCC